MMIPCGFNTLVPAFIFSVNLTSFHSIGDLDTGARLGYAQANGFMRSVPGFPVDVNATIVHIDDLPLFDPTNIRLNIRGTLQTEDNHYISTLMQGPLKATQKVIDIVGHAKNATITDWGEQYNAFYWTFFAKDGKYQVLQDSQWVSSARLFAGNDHGIYCSLEYRISQVSSGPLCKDGQPTPYTVH